MINSTVSLGKELIPFFPWQLWKLASLNSRSIHLVTLKFPLQNILKLLSLNPILFMVKKAKNSIQFFFFIKNYSLHIFVYMTMSQSTKFTKTNLFYVTLQHAIKKSFRQSMQNPPKAQDRFSPMVHTIRKAIKNGTKIDAKSTI